jgi:(DL)-glycerol-3-phosphatase
MMQDTESFYTIVQQKILQRFGKEFTWELKAKMMGQKALPAAQTLVSELGLEGQLTPEDFVKEREEMLQTMFPEAKLLPGAAKLVEHLKGNNVCPRRMLQSAAMCSAAQKMQAEQYRS